jgi:hypothetical protein
MFKVPDNRLSASNQAVLSSESFFVPVILRSVGRSSKAAFEELRKAFIQVEGFIPALTSTVPGVSLMDFDSAISPRISRVEIVLQGKEHQFELTFAFRCPIPKEQDFWTRIQFISGLYDLFSELAKPF